MPAYAVMLIRLVSLGHGCHKYKVLAVGSRPFSYVYAYAPLYAYALVDSEDWVICANVLLLICFFHYFEELSIFSNIL